MRITFVLSVVLLLVFSTILPVMANPPANPPEKSNISVVVFLDKVFRDDNQSLEILKKGLNDRFNGANVAIYGDNSPKSPEFLEFIEKVQTDPANERGIRLIPAKYLYKYGDDTHASHVLLINIKSANSDIGFWSSKRLARIKEDVTVFSVEPNKIVLNSVFDTGEKLLPFREAIQLSMLQLKKEFNWIPQPSQENEIKPVPANLVSILAFLPARIQVEPELYLKVKNAISEKVKNADITIYNDFQAKSPEYMEFIGKVITDSSMQRSFIIKKDHIVKYGKDSGYRAVVVFKLGITEEEEARGLSFGTVYRLKEDISVVSVESNKYIANYVFDNEKKMFLTTAVDNIMDKFKSEFNLPAEVYLVEE